MDFFFKRTVKLINFLKKVLTRLNKKNPITNFKMQTVSKKDPSVVGDELYFQKFTAKNGEEYGIRFGTPNDAKIMSEIFTEVYGYNYDNPFVYDIDLFKEKLANKDNFWFVGEVLKNREITGGGVIEKKRYIAHAGKAVVRKKFQGLGVTAKIGAAGIITVSKMPEFKDVLRLDTETRASSIKVQKLIQKAGAIPYALVPAYINFGDRRFYKINDNIPFPPQKVEAAFLYSIIFRGLWKKRDKHVYLLNNEDLIYIYEFMKKNSNRMKNDELILENSRSNKDYELYGVSKNHYEGLVNLYGYIKEKSLKNLLKTYREWRIILWRIPTTLYGISSMSLALDKGFKIVGYDIGFNNINWTLFDSVLFAYYPNYNCEEFEVNCTDTPKPLVKKIKELFST